YLFLNSTQLMRQMLATPFILFALSYYQSGRRKLCITYLILATCTHLASLPIFFIILLLISDKILPKIWMVFISSIFVLLLTLVIIYFLTIFSIILFFGELVFNF